MLYTSYMLAVRLPKTLFAPTMPQLLPTGESRVRVAAIATGAAGIVTTQTLTSLNKKSLGDVGCTKAIFMQSPAQFAASPDMTRRATIFLRPELRVWQNLDVEFLTTFIISRAQWLKLW
ncbi:hypothetical protein EV424DRAFT_548146 [Suillus variegatus]|nr:hypothetical protein EV424DRAFT_548146 [Suillus variegatus]